MPLTDADILKSLERIPGLAGTVRAASASGGAVTIRAVAPAGAAPDQLTRLARAAFATLAAGAKGGEVIHGLSVEFVTEAGEPVHSVRLGAKGGGDPAPESAPAGHRPIKGLSAGEGSAGALPDVKRIIAVGAGKGGVGKSTIAVNLAVGLARKGFAVGVLDGDIYGPSLPTLLALGSMDTNVVGGLLQPFRVHGVKAMTIGKLVDPEKPLVWRGPMAHGAFKQLIEQTAWGELDYLIIDLPPGTGDVSLTMAQMLKLTGAVVVCTPQKVAQDDAVRAARMFQQLGIEVLGVVENMSSFIADDLDPPREYDLFGKGGAERMAQRLNLPFLGAVPLTIALRVNSDAGDPSANFAAGPKGAPVLAAALEALVDAVDRQAAIAAVRQAGGPTLNIS